MLNVLDNVTSLEYRHVDMERINKTRTPRLSQGDVYHPYRSLLRRRWPYFLIKVLAIRRLGGRDWLFKALLTNLMHVMGITHRFVADPRSGSSAPLSPSPCGISRYSTYREIIIINQLAPLTVHAYCHLSGSQEIT